MKAWGRFVCLACAASALPILPQAASAQPGYYVSKPSRLMIAYLKASNGYRIDLITFGAKRLVLAANHFGPFGERSFSSQSAGYIAPRQAARPDELHATLGKLGHVSLRFHASEPPRPEQEPGTACKGRSSTAQKGRFVGSIQFRGERGFTSLRASSATGQILRRFKQVCRRPHEPRGGSTERRALSLGAYVKGNPDKAWFGAYELAPTSSGGSDDVSYSASVTEHRGRLTISRSANAVAEPSTLAVSDPSVRPATATVAPPFPFSGTATLEHAPGAAPTWSGDLGVDLPGLGALPLTGPSFSASLCRKNLSCLCPPGRPCALLIAGRPQLGTAPLIRRAFAQGSGSQSQAFWDVRLSWSR
jgi:hypothetical protein